VPNKFPALMVEGDVNPRISQLHSTMNGIGAHEIVIETPEHLQHIGTMSESQVKEVLTAYRDRYVDLMGDRRFKYILIFKNHGAKAGASLSHPHSQIIATPIVPRQVMEELDNARNYFQMSGGNCIYDDIIELEMESEERVVLKNKSFIALSPFAARYPFETWILPTRHEPYFEKMTDEERADLASIMSKLLSKMDKILKNPPYNYYIHTSPTDRQDHRSYHWHIEITPRLTHAAGFERGSGFYINPVPPEDATRFLRYE
jgi:UDPglucose--hexose-1-phosphate uridylyltransferase